MRLIDVLNRFLGLRSKIEYRPRNPVRGDIGRAIRQRPYDQLEDEMLAQGISMTRVNTASEVLTSGYVRERDLVQFDEGASDLQVGLPFTLGRGRRWGRRAPALDENRGAILQELEEDTLVPKLREGQ